MMGARSCSVAFLVLTLAPACITDESTDALDVSTQEIVGGTATQITTVPWQVSLQSGGSHFCGGTIVTPTWIVTAAHCVADGAPERIVAGISRLSQSASGQIRTVKRVISYPGYSDPTVGKDAALIELSTPLTLDGTSVRAIRPVTSGTVAALTAPGVMATVSGWGTTTEGATALPDQLQSVQVPIVALTSASTAYNMSLTDDQLAAGVSTGGKDSCQGDSGGPLVVFDNGEPVLAGIVSWGEGCARANLPGLYGRVGSFAKWMDGYAGGPPVAAAGADFAVKPNTRVQLDGSASADTGFGQIATYAWRQVAGNGVVLDGASSKQASFTAPGSYGTLEFELTVVDEGGNTATDRIVVTVAANGGGGTGTGTGGDDITGSEDVIGGCSATGPTGPALVVLVLGALVGRRKRK